MLAHSDRVTLDRTHCAKHCEELTGHKWAAELGTGAVVPAMGKLHQVRCPVSKEL